MATSLAANRASSTNQTLTFFRYAFSSLRNFSTSTTPTPAQTPSSDSPAKKSKRRKKKNLFEVAQFLPKWGLGYHMAKSHWTNVSYEITKINLYKDGRHGKAWGLAYKDGIPAADAPKKISGVHKRCWKYLPGLEKLNQNLLNSPTPTETSPKAEEAQVA
ncbi:hypothetical protein LINPERHAP1_LOCUS38246 [Linum perenne]